MKAYRLISLSFAGVFAAVGAVFLLAPQAVAYLFAQADAATGRPGMPAGDADAALFRALAAAYMYVVTLLAWKMYRQPAATMWPTLLAHAKFASAAASFVLFFARGPYLVLAANGIVDGLIGAAALALRRRAAMARARATVHESAALPS